MKTATLFKKSKIQTAHRLQEIFGLPKKPALKKMLGTQGLTYLMNKETIVKIPLTNIQMAQLKAAVALLTLLKRKTAIRTPDLKLYPFLPKKDSTALSADGIGAASDESVIGCYPLLKGAVFSSMTAFFDEKVSVRENAIYELGKFVADLHTLTPIETGALKIDTARDYLRNILFEDFKNETQDVPDFKRNILLGNIYNHIFNGCDNNVLCHMDLHMGNMCFDKNFQKLTGVFDFGSMIAAPKELEFMTIAGVYDEELAAFKAGYQAQSRKAADFESPQFRRVCKYLSPFSRWREMPALIRQTKQKI